MIADFITILQRTGLEMTAEEIADALWLALRLSDSSATATTSQEKQGLDDTLGSAKELMSASSASSLSQPVPSGPPEATNVLLMKNHASASTGQNGANGAYFRSPAATALPGSLRLARALRLLKIPVPSRTQYCFDEQATIRLIAESNARSLSLVLRPMLVQRFDLALVIDTGASMELWSLTIRELYLLLERSGAFRVISLWQLDTNEPDQIHLYRGFGSRPLHRRDHHPREILDARGQHLILVVTDCISPAWQSGKAQAVLTTWSRHNALALVNMLPTRLWLRTALKFAQLTMVHALTPGSINAKLGVDTPLFFSLRSTPIPILTLEPQPLMQWAHMLSATGKNRTPAVIFQQEYALALRLFAAEAKHSAALSPQERVKRFREVASPTAFKLARLLAAAPLSMSVIYLIQQTMLPSARQIHVAELFLSGLIEKVPHENDQRGSGEAEEETYDFLPGVRSELLNVVPAMMAFQVLTAISHYIEQHYGQARDFLAWLTLPDPARDISEIPIPGAARPFARVTATVWRKFGRERALLANHLEQHLADLSLPSTYSTEPAERVLSSVDSEETEQNATGLPEASDLFDDPTTLRAPDLLFGRSKEVARIFGLLKNRQSVSLVGPRRIGKTSLLRALGNSAIQKEYAFDGKRFSFIYHDLQRHSFDKKAYFFDTLLSLLKEYGQEQGYIVREQEKDEEFEALLQEFARHDLHPVLILDAFDEISQFQSIDEGTFGFLRAMAASGNLSFIAASEDMLSNIMRKSLTERELTTSPFFNIFATIRLTSLSREDARAFLADISARGGLPFQETEIDWLIQMADTHPYLLQQVAALLFEEKRTWAPQEPRFQRIREEAQRQLFSHFEDCWRKLPPGEQAVLLQEVRAGEGTFTYLPEYCFSELFQDYLRETGKLHVPAPMPGIQDLKTALTHLYELTELGMSVLSETPFIAARIEQQNTKSALTRGKIVRDVLDEMLKSLKGQGERRDGQPDWHEYNVLYHRYFARPNLRQSQREIADRLGISERQYYRLFTSALKRLHQALLEMEDRYEVGPTRSVDSSRYPPFDISQLGQEELKQILNQFYDPQFLGASNLARTPFITAQLQRHHASLSVEKGKVLQTLLKETLENLRGSGQRSDTERDWLDYNVLYYRYFLYKLSVSHKVVAQRLGFSERQYYSLLPRALDRLWKALMDREATYELAYEEAGSFFIPPQETVQARATPSFDIRTITTDELKQLLSQLDDLPVLSASALTGTPFIAAQLQQHHALSTIARGKIVQNILKEILESMKGQGQRSDAARDWLDYNVLYYRYFTSDHYRNQKFIADRLGFSESQYYNLLSQALDRLKKALADRQITYELGQQEAGTFFASPQATRQIQATPRFDISSITTDEIKQLLNQSDDLEILGTSALSGTPFIAARLQQQAVSTLAKGKVVQNVLKEVLESMKGQGQRSDAARDWLHYNILSYRYFTQKNTISPQMISYRLGFSERQHRRLLSQALHHFKNGLLAMQAAYEIEQEKE